ncbi:MAG: hypothetical protein M3144_04910 [Actinomycetota bacterium]|nr:hypothetical protein [Actinomycetota bacterium]
MPVPASDADAVPGGPVDPAGGAETIAVVVDVPPNAEEASEDPLEPASSVTGLSLATTVAGAAIILALLRTLIRTRLASAPATRRVPMSGIMVDEGALPEASLAAVETVNSRSTSW